MRLDEHLRPINQGAGRPEAFIAFAFVETQWNTLCSPPSSARRNTATRPCSTCTFSPAWRDWRLRDIERLAIQHRVAEKFRQQCGWQTVRVQFVGPALGILETAVEYGYLSVNPARGVKFPQQELKEKPAIIAGDSFAKLLQHSRGTVSNDGESHRRDGTKNR